MKTAAPRLEEPKEFASRRTIKTRSLKARSRNLKRLSDDKIIAELCDRGLLRPFNDRLFQATDKAKKYAAYLKSRDEVRVFVYAPDAVKKFFRIMAISGASLRVLSWDDDFAYLEMKYDKIDYYVERFSRQVAEDAITYLLQEKLVDDFRVVDENGMKLYGLSITNRFDFRFVYFPPTDSKRFRIVGDVSKRGQRVARIDLENLDKKTKESVDDSSKN